MQEQGDARDEVSRGWDAITATLDRHYPDREPMHFGPPLAMRLGGDAPLEGISVYRVETPRPHWHFVTYGLSDLHDASPEPGGESGYGFELTMRVADDAALDDDARPPGWAMDFLQNLARYVFGSGNVFEAGHYMHLNGPIALEQDTRIESVAFVRDPVLDAIETPNGSIEFRQVVGITVAEERAFKCWRTLDALAVMAPALPMLLTDLSRPCLLDDPAIASAMAEGAARDGSSTGFLYMDTLAWQSHKRLFRGARIDLVLGARQVAELAMLLPGRLPFGRPMVLSGPDSLVVFEPGERTALVPETDENGRKLRVVLDPVTARALVNTLRPVAGDYRVPGLDALTLRVQQTQIRDREGIVVRTIG